MYVLVDQDASVSVVKNLSAEDKHAYENDFICSIISFANPEQPMDYAGKDEDGNDIWNEVDLLESSGWKRDDDNIDLGEL